MNLLGPRGIYKFFEFRYVLNTLMGTKRVLGQFIWLLIVAVLMTGCDYTLPFWGKYRLVRCNGSEVRLAHSIKFKGLDLDRLDIDGNIVKVGLKPPYLTGYADNSCQPPGFEIKEGYFLINTDTDSIQQGLTESQWRSQLDGIGWGHPWLFEPPYLGRIFLFFIAIVAVAITGWLVNEKFARRERPPTDHI